MVTPSNASLVFPLSQRSRGGTPPGRRRRPGGCGRSGAALEALGFRIFAAEVRQIPSDAQRIVARQLEWTNAGFTVTDGRGTRHDCPSATLALLQPGFRTAVQAEVVKTTERKFSLGRALATGGISISKKVEKVTEQVSTSRESYILVVRTGGLPGIMLYESRLNFQCLGAELKPFRHLNLKAVLERLRALGPVPVDDRTAQPAFLRGLPSSGWTRPTWRCSWFRQPGNPESAIRARCGSARSCVE